MKLDFQIKELLQNFNFWHFTMSNDWILFFYQCPHSNMDKMAQQYCMQKESVQHVKTCTVIKVLAKNSFLSTTFRSFKICSNCDVTNPQNGAKRTQICKISKNGA